MAVTSGVKFYRALCRECNWECNLKVKTGVAGNAIDKLPIGSKIFELICKEFFPINCLECKGEIQYIEYPVVFNDGLDSDTRFINLKEVSYE